MDPAPKIEKHIITYVEKFLAIMVIISGLVPLSGWLIQRPVLASLGDGFIPMAPSTALFFVFFGVLMLFFERTGKNTTAWRSGFILILVSSLTAVVLLWFSFHSRYFPVETLGFSITTLPNDLPTGHMSPLTAFCFLVTGLAFLILLFNPEKSTVKATWALGFSTILFLVTLNLLFAYLIGAPVFYNGNIIPPAITTTIGFVFLGFGLMVFSGKQFAIESISLKSYSRKTSLFLILVFIVLAAGIVISGNFYFRSFEKNFKQQVGNNLISITKLKIHQLTQWRNERLGDAEIIRHDEDFSGLVASCLKDKNDQQIKTKLKKRLKLELEAYNYDAFSIFDINRQQQIAFPDINMEKDSVLTKDIQSVLDNRKIFFRDFYKNFSDGGIYLQLLVPITDHLDTAKVIAVAAIRINPYHYLYQGINEWPVVSQTAETSIVRKEGDSIVFLNDLRFIKNSALVFKWPLSDHKLPAVQAVMGTRGVIEGTDYRNVPVLASVNAIGNSPWYIVDSIDISDVYAPLRERLRITVFMISILILGIGFMVGFIWHQQNTKFYKKQFEATDQIRKLNRIFNVLSNINQAIVRIRKKQDLFEEVCKIAIKDGEFMMVWIGLLDVERRKVEIKGHAGDAGKFLGNLHIVLDDPVMGQTPYALAILSKDHVVINDLSTDPRATLSRENALSVGYRSLAVFPIVLHQMAEGVISFYSKEKDFFTEEELSLLDELARDLAFALEFALQEEERRKAEESVRASEKRFHGTLDTMIEGCQIISFDWKYLYMNDAAIAHGKIKKADIIGKTMMECYPGIESTPMFRKLQQCMVNRTIEKFENEFQYPDGSRAWFELSVHPVEEGLFILSLDISTRKLSQLALAENENILRQAQSVAKVGSWSIDLNSKESKWSLETYRIFNIPEDTRISFDFFLSLVHPDDREIVRKVAEGSLQGQLYDIEHRIIVNNKVRWVREIAEINYDESGNPIRRIGTVQDITERKQADEKIHLLNAELELRISQRTEQLQAANKELEAFAYSVSHDLRAPLRSIIGYSNILAEEYHDKVDEEGHRIIQTIIKNTHRMGQLIDDLLEFSRMGRKNLSRDPVNMNTLVNEVVEDMRVNENNRKIEFNILTLLPCKVDRNMMQQVWINLVSNALKYTRKKDVARIEIGSETDQDTIHYYIRDNGVGFDMKYSHKLFGVFQRLHTTDEFEGTGVGLALVKRIINRHGGEVWADSIVDKGTILHFSIPR